MSRQSETGCMIWLGIGGFLLLINILKENPMIIVYAVLGLGGISLIVLFLNFLHTLYLINFNYKIKSILEFNEQELRMHSEKLLEMNRTEKTEIDERYFRFISSSKIFDI